MERQQTAVTTLGDSPAQALLEKRYDDMKRFYEVRVRDLERELYEYKELVNRFK